MNSDWDPRSWGLFQLFVSFVLILVLPVGTFVYAHERWATVLFFLELLGIGVLARLLPAALRKRHRSRMSSHVPGGPHAGD